MFNTYLKDQINSINDDQADDISFNLTHKQALELSKQIMELNKEKKSVHEDTDPEIERLTNWRDDHLGRIDKKIERLTDTLLEYYQINKQQDTKFKFDTPYAHVSDRKKTTWNWDDEKETIASLEDNDQDKFIKKSVDRAGLKKAVNVVNGKAVTKDGVVLDGVTITEGRSISLKAEGE